MPRKTKAQIALLLADLDAAKRDKRKAETRVDEIEAELREIDPAEGTYGDWSFSYGTAREILDQQGIRELVGAYAKSTTVVAAVKAAKLPTPTVPTKFTKEPIVVKLIEAKK